MQVLLGRLSVAGVFMMAITGCVGAGHSSNYRSTASLISEQKQLNTEAEQLRSRRADLHSQKANAKTKEEVERLEQEIKELEDRIAQLEKQMAQLKEQETLARVRADSNAMSGNRISPGPNRYGPRGGCYRITKSGKKDYGAC